MNTEKKEIFEENKEYVAIINSGKCKTPLRFRKVLVEAFYLPEIAYENINDNLLCISNNRGF